MTMPTLTRCSLIVSWLALVAEGAASAAESPLPPEPPRIAETQLTLRVNPVQGRATVIRLSEDTLTVVTAAHFLSAEDVGKLVQIQNQFAGRLAGSLVSVVRNPAFRTIRSRESNEELAFGTLGVDTAVAVLKVDLRPKGAHLGFAKIRAAELSPVPITNGLNQVLTVNIVDQQGEEHVVRAGNHLNPKCLAWGRRGYDTQRGDSGAGVFLLRKSTDGKTWPILIGNVSQSDPRGGIGSLTSRGEPWIEKALAGQNVPGP
jgi:hypothetical protein